MKTRTRDKTIAVLLGGMSSEREVSLASGKAVAEALRSRGHQVVEIDAGRDLAQQLVDAGADVAVIMLHGTFGEDGCVQGLLEVMGIPYTGSSVRASAVAMDKVLTKRILASAGMAVAADVVLSPDEALSATEVPLALPVVVKPAAQGSSVGISIVRDADELVQALRAAAPLGQVLVETFVAGPEVTVSFLDGEALPPVEIRPHQGFYDYTNKYTSGRTSYICPAEIDEKMSAHLQTMASQACDLLGVEGVARVDFLLGGGADPVLLEVNTVPGMTELSLVPMAAREAGLTFEDLAERILSTARLETAGREV
jgi:D-alanine-D-alanine ligase